jgi:lipopolysaccharide transport system permease protein
MLQLLNVSRDQWHYFLVPTSPLRVLWQHRRLVGLLTARDIESKYRGSWLGILWTVITPLLLLAVYTFIFSTVFQARWKFAGDVNPSEQTGEFALILFSGLIVFNFFSECIARAPSLMLENISYIKRVVFPLEVLPWVALSSAGVTLAVSFGVFLVFYASLIGPPPLTVIGAPAVWVPLFLTAAGVSWFFASFGVFVRDLRQIVGLLSTMLMFLSPVFYPIDAVPERFRQVMLFNPLTLILEQTRDCLFRGVVPDLDRLAISWGVSLVVAWLGLMWFVKTKKGFADVV